MIQLMPRKASSGSGESGDTNRTKTVTQEELETVCNAVARIHGRLLSQLETMQEAKIPSVRFFGGGMHERGTKILNQFAGNLIKAVDLRLNK